MLKLDTMDAKRTVRLNTATKSVGGGQIRLNPVAVPITRPEPSPVDLDAPATPVTSRRPKLDTLNKLAAAVTHAVHNADAYLNSPTRTPTAAPSTPIPSAHRPPPSSHKPPA
ncbi:MAG: hypothetical protein CK431_10035 [Mycobacterium sp.]|nr:MAG: hypothetical protein CK431_10035 [Mycobacterium sp.]